MKLQSLFIIGAMLLTCVGANAQIGYQVAIIDQAKGTPKANETVSVSVTITDNYGATICTETQSGTTDEFGILSMQVGSASTFDNVDWSKLPLWISAKVGDITISKTQILSVPVAEYAKNTGELTEKLLSSKTWHSQHSSFRFSNGTLTITDDEGTSTYSYCISGNTIICKRSGSTIHNIVLYYHPKSKTILRTSSDEIIQ